MFAPIRRMMAVVSSILLLALGAATAAEDFDKTAVQGMISRQLDAFKHDDAATAYGFAAPQIKQMFSDPAGFMDMVKRGYAPVYRAKSFTFGTFRTEGKMYAQAVTIVDANGQLWDALYSLERGTDGQLHISGCALVKSPEIST